MMIPRVRNIYIDPNTYRETPGITEVNLRNVKWYNNSMSYAFINCYDLQSVSNINENVTNMSSTFYSCSNLVNAPTIPNSVTDMSRTFDSCYSLDNTPIIGNSVINMSRTFYNCYSLVNAPIIPNSVTDMSYTFMYCYNLVNAPIIPNSVTNMGGTFYSCSNLVGDIYMYSENIFNAINCFFGSRLTKNVYIPFTYENGVNTQTYNSFINAGYNENGSSYGVYLKDINQL